MIKIRYRDPNELSPGLFAAAESNGRGTTVYLLSGLTAVERRAALRRLRLSARMGHCVRLPAAQLALALVADWVRTGFGRAGAVFRLHPAGSTVPVMVVSGGAVAFLLLSTVSIHVLRPPQLPDQAAPTLPAPSVSAIAAPGSGLPPSPGAGSPGRRGASDLGTTIRDKGDLGRSSVFGAPAISGFGTGTGALTAAGTVDGSGTNSGTGTGSGSGSGSGTGTGTGSGSGSGSGSGTGAGSGSGTGSGSGSGSGGAGGSTGGGDPGGTPTPAPSVTSPPASPTPDPASSPPAGTSGSGGTCLDLGPLGICLDV